MQCAVWKDEHEHKLPQSSSVLTGMSKGITLSKIIDCLLYTRLQRPCDAFDYVTACYKLFDYYYYDIVVNDLRSTKKRGFLW